MEVFSSPEIYGFCDFLSQPGRGHSVRYDGDSPPHDPRLPAKKHSVHWAFTPSGLLCGVLGPLSRWPRHARVKRTPLPARQSTVYHIANTNSVVRNSLCATSTVVYQLRVGIKQKKITSQFTTENQGLLRLHLQHVRLGRMFSLRQNSKEKLGKVPAFSHTRKHEPFPPKVK